MPLAGVVVGQLLMSNHGLGRAVRGCGWLSGSPVTAEEATAQANAATSASRGGRLISAASPACRETTEHDVRQKTVPVLEHSQDYTRLNNEVNGKLENKTH